MTTTLIYLELNEKDKSTESCDSFLKNSFNKVVEEIYIIESARVYSYDGAFAENLKKCNINNSFKKIVNLYNGLKVLLNKKIIKTENLLIISNNYYGPFIDPAILINEVESLKDFEMMTDREEFNESLFIGIKVNDSSEDLLSSLYKSIKYGFCSKNEILNSINKNRTYEIRYVESILDASKIAHGSVDSSKKYLFANKNIFNIEYMDMLNLSVGDGIVKFMNYLKDIKVYPLHLIYDDISKRLDNSTIRELLHLTFVVEDKESFSRNEKFDSVAIVIFSYYEDLVELNIKNANNLPSGVDVYIVVVSDHLESIWHREKTKIKNASNVYIRKQENRGRNENAYWLTCRDVIEKYEFICLAHDKKSPSAKPYSRGIAFSDHCWNGILKSKEYVENILYIFSENKHIGILMPTAPLFANFTKNILNNEWGSNKIIAKEVYEKLSLSVPFDEKPVPPFGAMFWVRGKAMRSLYNYNWSIQDFPEEPIKKDDGTILHALERMYPMIAQEAGYLSAWVVSSSCMELYYDNVYYQLKESLKENNVNIEKRLHFSQIIMLLKDYFYKKYLTKY